MTMENASSIKTTARLAGILYVVMSILMVFGFMYIPATFVVSGDAAATAHNITEATLLYRVGILTAFVSHIFFIVVVLTLYKLFKDVDRKHATFMAVLVCVGVAAEIVRLGFRIAPLILLSDADFLSVFNKPQLEALALGSLRLGDQLGQLFMLIWGLWLFPFGVLTIRSRWFPKFLGILLIVAGFAYVVTWFTANVFPGYMSVVSKVMFPLVFGELGIVFWMAIMGAKLPVRKAAHT